jgi:hypothetical protein
MGRESNPNSPTLQLCRTAIFYSPCFPSLKNLAATSSTRARAVINGISCMEAERKKDFLDSPGMVELLRSSLNSTDATIATNFAATIANLCLDETTASAILDSQPDLVQTLVDTFCTSGFCEKFKCKTQLH